MHKAFNVVQALNDCFINGGFIAVASIIINLLESKLHKGRDCTQFVHCMHA